MEITGTESQRVDVNAEISVDDNPGVLGERALEAHFPPELPVASSSKRPQKASVPLEPLEDILHQRVSTIREGDNVLLRLPSDAIKAVVASKDG